MANYFKELNEAFDRKFALNNVVESKCRNLVETAEADWDWYEDGFTSPLYRLYGQAFEEAGFDEHADVQSGMGEVYISKKGDPEGMFVANFEDVNDFMNRIHTSMVQGKLTDEKRIKEIIFQGVLDISRWREYPDVENSNESFKKDTKSKKLIKEDGAKDFLDNLSSNLLLDLYDFIFEDVYDAAEDLGSLPDYLPMTAEKATKDFVDAVKKLAEAAFIKYCVDKRDDEAFDEGVVKTLAQPIRDAADTVRDVLNIPDKNTKLDEDKGSLGNEIDRYQKWVDFDMSRYGKISERTQQMVNKAGYQIIKDDHGDYEVAAGHFE